MKGLVPGGCHRLDHFPWPVLFQWPHSSTCVMIPFSSLAQCLPQLVGRLSAELGRPQHWVCSSRGVTEPRAETAWTENPVKQAKCSKGGVLQGPLVKLDDLDVVVSC